MSGPSENKRHTPDTIELGYSFIDVQSLARINTDGFCNVFSAHRTKTQHQILAPTRRGTSSTAMRIALPQAKFNTNAVHNAGSYIKPR
ncbi:hypothetical protein [Corynebacterium belfantii]|uniref:hypothetical protein n=1 Tax=Corynebacterium belfantii TaxID=2014537 RepID=UPI0035A82ED8